MINHLELFKLNVNVSKSKVCPNLEVDLPNKLSPTDFYLGIPFTRDVKLYGELILSEFQKNKMNLSWLDIYDNLCNDKSDEITKIIIGYFNYKLKPLIIQNDDEILKETIKKFIFNNYVKTENESKLKRFYMIVFINILIIIALIYNIL